MNRIQELSRRLLQQEKQARVTQDKNDQPSRAGTQPRDTITGEDRERRRRAR